MKMSFVVETDKMDNNKDIILFEGVRNFDRMVPLQRNFEPEKTIDESCIIIQDGGFILATANVELEHYNLFPAVGIDVRKGDAVYDEETGITTIHSCRIFAVSLSDSNNSNPEIRSIAEQLTNGQAKIVE